MKIIKRNGSEAVFDITKIISAITKANKVVPEAQRLTKQQIIEISDHVQEVCYARGHAMNVEEIQDMVENQIMKPKAEYFDELVDRNLLTGIRETAGELGVKQNQFVAFLLEKKYMYRDKKGKLTAYAKPLSDGLFERKECVNEKTQWKGTQDLVTPKGRETFRLLMVGA